MTTRTEPALRVSNSHSVPRRSEAKTVQQLLIIVIIAIAATAFNANAQEGYTQNSYLYVAGGKVGKYRLDGSIVNASLIPGVDGLGLAISGTNIYVANDERIGKYSTSGKTINASLITTGAEFYGVAIAGTNLFVEDFEGDTVSEYSTSGTPINNPFYPEIGQPAAIAISGSDGRVFVGYNGGFAGHGAIAIVSTNGFAPNFITNLDLPTGLAISGTNIFVSDIGSNNIGEYTTSGQTINASLITGLSGAAGIAILGTNLFVINNNSGYVSEYSTSGLLINPALIKASGAWGLAIGLMPLINVAPAPAIGNQIALYYPIWATNYVVQSAPTLTSSAWANITNGTPMTGVLVPNTPSAGGVAYRLVPAQ